MSIIKVKTQTRFMVLFTSRSSLTWGNLQVPCMASPPGIYLLPSPNNQLSHFYRDSMMTEFAFFDSKEEWWGDNMRALWGNLSICPHLDHLELPSHTPGELLSISHLKVWGMFKSLVTTWPIFECIQRVTQRLRVRAWP